MPDPRVVDWLLEPEQPAIRYLALTQLLGRKESDSDVREARERIPRVGWVADMLSKRDPGGWWVRNGAPMFPKYVAMNWNLLAMADLGASRFTPEVAASCELWMAKTPLKNGGVGAMGNQGIGHLCFTGNMAGALVKFGYGDDPRIRRTFEWLVQTAHPNGGWSCWNFTDGPSKGRNLDSWEGLAAFAVYPRTKWSPAMKACVERGSEFFLDHELHAQGDRYPPWYRFHWPTHAFYDILAGLDMLTALGYTDDRRLAFALEHLKKKQRSDGRWNLDAAHPDWVDRDGTTSTQWYAKHPDKRPAPLNFEVARRPSKMITLTALRVLDRVGA